MQTAKPKTTKIVIAQRISSIEDADQIIVLDDGKINDIGNHEQLLKRNNCTFLSKISNVIKIIGV